MLVYLLVYLQQLQVFQVSGKSSLVSQALPELVLSYLGNESETENNNENNPLNEGNVGYRGYTGFSGW